MVIRKRFGQHFLHDPAVIRRIVDSVAPSAGERIVEIGPGRGALTWALLVAYGAYYGLTEGGEKALVADLAPSASRGRAYGALHAITGLAVLPANAIFGALYSGHVALAFQVSAGCAGVAAVGLALLPGGARATD